MAWRCNKQCENRTQCFLQKRYPGCQLGRILMLVGLVLVVVFATCWFWMALIGAILILVGYLVLRGC
ncbi:MAG: hypothetical protein RR482_04985 [Clostridia bacterium]